MLHPDFRRHLKLTYCSCLISCIVFLAGSSIVLSSTLLPELRASIEINEEDASWIASLQFLVCPIGSLATGALSDKIGRRKSIQLAFIPIIIGWTILIYANSVSTIIIGRFFMGLTAGSAPFVILYVAEVCPTEHRTLYTSLVNIYVGAGMMTGSALSLFLSWHSVAAVMTALAVAGCGSIFLLPEPPLWLRSKGRTREAKCAEQWFGMEPPPASAADAARSDATRSDAADATRPAAATKTTTPWSTYAQPTVWKPTLIMMAFFVCQQGCGFYVLLLYSSDVINDCHVSLDGAVFAILLSASRVAGSVTFSLLSRVNRRTLLVWSSISMGASIAVFVVHLKWRAAAGTPPDGVVVAAALVVFVFTSLLAAMPLPWILGGELFPMAVKGKMCAVVNIFGNEIMFSVGKIYPMASLTFGITNVWSVFAFFCVITALFGAFIMPETKGKSLDDILKSFESKKNQTTINTF